MDEYEDLKITDSEDDEGAGERVRIVMEEIYKNQDKIKSEKDIDAMAERCTKMMTQMRNEAYSKKKDKKGHRASGSGDKATPPPSRVSLKESPRKDSTKPTTSPRLPPSVKAALKEQIESKKKPGPSFAELYKEKMDKLKVPKNLTKMDSAKMIRGELHGRPPVRPIRREARKLDDTYFNGVIASMKEKGVEVKGKETEPAVDRILKTIHEGSGMGSGTTIVATSEEESDTENTRVLEEERKIIDQKLKEMERKNPPLQLPRKLSELRKTQSWKYRQRQLSSTNLAKDGASRTHKAKMSMGSVTKEKLLGEGDFSKFESSDAETDAEDPFSKTKEGKNIIRKMNKYRTETTFRPSLEAVDISQIGMTLPDWCDIARAQSASRASTGWTDGEVIDVDSLRLQHLWRRANRNKTS